MSRIIISNSTLIGRELINLASTVIKASAQANRLKAIVDAATTADAANVRGLALETSAEAQFPAGSGATIYGGIAQIQADLAGLAATMSIVDQLG